MPQVLVDSALVDTMLYGFIGAVIVAIIVLAAWFVQEHWRTPKESKEIRSCSNQKKPLMVFGCDEGYADFFKGDKTGPEGLLETKELKKGEDTTIGFLARKSEIDDVEFEVGEGKDKEKTLKVAKYIVSLASRKLYLRDAKVPVWFGYRGKTVLTSIYSLAALTMVEGLQAQGMLLTIDLTAIKNLFQRPWDQTQRNAQGQRRENIGFRKGRKLMGREGWLWPILIVGFAAAMMILLLVFIKFVL